MNVEPARVDQIRKTDDDSWMVIDASVGGVAADLKRIDKGFQVRFSKSGKCWVVFHEHHDGCPHNGTGGPGSTYLVTTAQAYQGRTGIWTGLDDRVVEKVASLNPERGYDFVREVEKQNREAAVRRRKEFSERVGPLGEIAAHAARKDLGERYKGRAFITKKESA